MARRRGNGEGGITKRKRVDKKTGKEIITWQGYVITGHDPESGKERKKYFYGKTRQAVADKIDDARNLIKQGTWQEPSKLLISEWLDAWLHDYIKPGLRITTWDSYDTQVKKHLKPAIGHIRLTELKTANLQKLYTEKLSGGRADKKPGGLSVKSVKYIHTVIHAALEQARKEGIITINPADAVKLPEYDKPDIKAMTEADIIIFLSNAKDTRHFPLYYLALNTGMRRGELLGLRWSCVDMDRGTVTVTQNLVRTSEGLIFQQPKTKLSRRTVTIGPAVINVLKEHKARQDEERAAAGESWQGHDLVFCNEIGGTLCPRALTRHYERLLKRAGLDFTFHGLRHTYATLSIEKGVSPRTIQEALGHHSAAFTLDVYSSVTDRMKQEATDKIGGLMADLLQKDSGHE